MSVPRQVDWDKRGPLRNSDPADTAKPVTKSDTNDIHGSTFNAETTIPCSAFSVAVGGDVVVITAKNDTVTLTVPAGVIPLRIKQIKSTNTTASGFVAYFHG